MSLRPNNRTELHRYDYKYALDADEGRRRRADDMVQIRKSKREESLRKRRREGLQDQQFSNSNFPPVSKDRKVALLKRCRFGDILEVLFESLQSMVSGVWSDDITSQLEATMQLRELLSSETNSLVEEVMQTGVVPRFVELLVKEDSPLLQLEAAWTLTNIASGTSEHTKVVVDHGAVPILVKLLSSPTAAVREEAVWALGNVAGESPEFRDLVLGHGALKPLLTLLNEHSSLSFVKIAIWTLSNLCRGRPPYEQVSPALSTIARLFHHSDEEVLSDTCWALSDLSDGSSDTFQAVVDAGVFPQLVNLLMHPSPKVISPALHIIGNIAGDDLQAQHLIDFGALPYLRSLLIGNYKKSIIKNACWTISNITAGSMKQIQAVIEAGLIEPLVNLAQNAEFDVKKHAVRALSNVTAGGTTEQIKFLVNQGCIKPLCEILECPDPGTIKVCLEALEKILQVGESEKNRGNTGDVNLYAEMIRDVGGVERIEDLQNHDNNDIFNKAFEILETYWWERWKRLRGKYNK